YGGVIIDAYGNFNGWAWGENIGWIHFNSSSPVAYKVQTAWKNSYDGNGDGTTDSQQGNVASLHTYNRQYYVTIAVPESNNLSNVQAVPVPAGAPNGASFQDGMFAFTISGLAGGGATTVTFYLPANTTCTTYYKYGKTPDNNSDHWYEFMYGGQTGAEINGNKITLHFVLYSLA
ncbi:MAG: hypothetical protein NT096_18085, partial [Proteobacteria bacterium]|nr:hypothetical protein [Pseudomonadota bacterium]